MYISQHQRCCDPQGRLLIVGLAAEIGDRLITFSFLRSLFQLFRFISFFATIKMCAKKESRRGCRMLANERSARVARYG